MIESKIPLFDVYKDCFLIIDEIGRENATIKTYGNETTPFIDHMLYRYNRGLKTFGITNFSMETLKEKYGQYVTDRFGEMFEIIELKDINHRK
jgi:DNA replication protein DnaC